MAFGTAGGIAPGSRHHRASSAAVPGDQYEADIRHHSLVSVLVDAWRTCADVLVGYLELCRWVDKARARAWSDRASRARGSQLVFRWPAPCRCSALTSCRRFAGVVCRDGRTRSGEFRVSLATHPRSVFEPALDAHRDLGSSAAVSSTVPGGAAGGPLQYSYMVRGGEDPERRVRAGDNLVALATHCSGWRRCAYR
jgi:hypothetical protein